MLIMSMAGSDRRGTSGGSEMKRALIALLILAPLLRAEDPGEKAFRPLSFSLFAGPNWSWYSRMPDIATIPEIRGELARDAGGVIGISRQYRLGDHFVLDNGLQISDRGTTVKWYENEELRSRWVYNFIVVSGFVGFRYLPFRGSSPYLLGGYEISYLGEHDLTDFGNSDDPVRTDLNADTWKFDLGVFAGAGFEVFLKGKRWVPFVEAGYHIGLLDISKGTGALESYPVIRTRTLMVLAGIRFRGRPAASSD